MTIPLPHGWTIRPTNTDTSPLSPEVRALVAVAVTGGGEVSVEQSPHSGNFAVEVSHDAYVAVIYCDPEGTYSDAHLSLDNPIIARGIADVCRYLRLPKEAQ